MTGADLVEVWLISTEQPRWLFDELLGMLDADEQARAQAITAPGRQAQFVIAHGAIRSILGELLQTAPAGLRWRHGRHGKPELRFPATELHCNLSHSGGLAAVAVSWTRAVGVDVQRPRDEVDPARMAARYYPADETASVHSAGAAAAERFTELWSRKEACVKVGGGRLIPALSWPAAAPSADGSFRSGPAGEPPCRVRDLAMPAGFHGAVAAAGPAPFRLVQHWWTSLTQPVRPQAPDPMVV